MSANIYLKYPIVCLVGMQCAGKDTIQSILAQKLNMNIIVSHTNRPMRQGEQNGREYNFVTQQQMLKAINNKDMVEFREYHTLVQNIPDVWYYGIHKDSIKNTDMQNNIVIVDPDGVKSLISYYGKENILSIYIDSYDEDREERCKRRGSYDVYEWERRETADYNKFTAYKCRCDYVVFNIENDLNNCCNTIIDYIQFENKMRVVDENLKALNDYIIQHQYGVKSKILK